MLGKQTYANGQRVYELADGRLTYYFKNGEVKAQGAYEDGQMEGEWLFYRATGELWQVGHFVHGKKDGSWTRYDRRGAVEYLEHFADGKVVSSPRKG